MRGVIFSVANCAATSKINVSAKIPNEIVVNFDADNNHAELIDENGDPQSVILFCDAHESLRQAINVKITGQNDCDVSYPFSDEVAYRRFGVKSADDDFLEYKVSIGRVDTNWIEPVDPDDTTYLGAVDSGGEPKFLMELELVWNVNTEILPGVTYQDTLTVDVTPAE